jgi:hypothetical protein
MTQENKPYVEGEKFTRAWINLEELPGGMMMVNGEQHGPVPASTSCWITTSEREAERLRDSGPVLEIFTQRPPEKTVLDVSDLYGNRDAVERVHHFYTRHAIGGLAAPDCLVCGRSTQGLEVSIRHQNLPDVVVCTECNTRSAKASPDAERERFLDYWCADIPDYLRDKWRQNVSELLDTPNANEKLQAAWDAWKAATGAPQ